MLYDRLLLDLNRAETAQQNQQWSVASENLIHAQAIVSELVSTLKTDAWDGGEGLKALYTYTLNAMMNANIHRDAFTWKGNIDGAFRSSNGNLESIAEAGPV